MDAVAAVVIDGNAFEVNFLDAFGKNAIAALFAAADAQIGHLDAPKAGIFVRIEVGWAQDEGRVTVHVLVYDVRGGPGAHDPGITRFHAQRLRDFIKARRQGHQSACLRDGI